MTDKEITLEEFKKMRCPVCNIVQGDKTKDWNCQYCNCGSLYAVNNFMIDMGVKQ